MSNYRLEKKNRSTEVCTF